MQQAEEKGEPLGNQDYMVNQRQQRIYLALVSAACWVLSTPDINAQCGTHEWAAKQMVMLRAAESHDEQQSDIPADMWTSAPEIAFPPVTGE